MEKIFEEWNTGLLDSFLMEITADILQQIDPKTNQPLVDSVLDTAGQKGTGKWTSVNALDMGVPAPTIAEAVFARCLSALKEERVHASKILSSYPHLQDLLLKTKRPLSKRFMTPYIVQKFVLTPKASN